jgi:glucokinase
MRHPLVLGVDIGGSHITAGLIDLRTRKLIGSSIKRSAVDPHESADEILNTWCIVIADAYAGQTISAMRIGMAVPGPFDYINGICLIEQQDKFKSLYLIDVKAELARRLKIALADIQFINDAEAFLKGEIFAASESCKSILGITLGTGLGSALYLNGKVRDADLWNDPFKDGIAEQYLAAAWLTDRYFQLSGQRLRGVKEIAESAKKDPNAKQVFAEFGMNLAKFLRPYIEKYKLEMILVGGNISYAFSHFSKALVAGLSHPQSQVTVKVSVLKENAALMGAAAQKFDKDLNELEPYNYNIHEK